MKINNVKFTTWYFLLTFQKGPYNLQKKIQNSRWPINHFLVFIIIQLLVILIYEMNLLILS